MASPNYAIVPALPPPPGVISNFYDPPSRAPELRIGMGVCIGTTSVLLVLRLYTKLAITHTAGWDDCKFLWKKKFSLKLMLTGACFIGFVGYLFERDLTLPKSTIQALIVAHDAVSFSCKLFCRRKCRTSRVS